MWARLSGKHAKTKENAPTTPPIHIGEPISRVMDSLDRLVIYHVNVDISNVKKNLPKNTMFLDERLCKDDDQGSLGRMFLALIISDLIIIDTTKHTSRWIWMLIDRAAIEKSNVLFVGSKKKTGNLYKSIGKNTNKWSNWIVENIQTLYRKKIKIQSKDHLFFNCIYHYIKTYLNRDTPMKELYWYESRARPLIDKLSCKTF